MRDRKQRTVLIAGPTASGKSALALAIAERDGGVVINADAAQVYSCWRVLTARPSDDDLARAPHRLYGHVPGGVRHSAGDWLRDVAGALAEARDRGVRAIVVGGTGLYFTALTEGLAEIPPISAEVRAASMEMLAAGNTARMLSELERADPETFARIDRANPMRVQRAWDVWTSTGRGLAAWHRMTGAPILAPDAACRLVVEPDVPMSNSNITRRFHAMMEDGALDECRAFAALGLDPSLPSARVIGAAPLMALLRGELDREAAAEAGVAATRQYAKRQRTWLRSRMTRWRRVSPGAEALAAVER